MRDAATLCIFVPTPDLVTILAPELLTSIASSNSPITAPAALNLTSSGSGGTGTYTYSWTGPGGWNSTDQNPSRDPSFASYSGTYTVTITDENSCTSTASTDVVITQPVLTTYYVNDGVMSGELWCTIPGDDLYPGTQEYPFATISHAISAAGSGNTINVDAGTYTEQLLIQKDLVLNGAGIAKTIVKAPADLSNCVAGITGVGTNWFTDYLLAAYPLDWNGAAATGTPITVKVTGFAFDANAAYHDCDRYSGVFFGCVKGATYADAGLFSSAVVNFNTADPSATGVRILGDSKLSVDNCGIDYTINGIAAYGDLSTAPDPDVFINANGPDCIKQSLEGVEYAISICFGATGVVNDNVLTDPSVNGIFVSSSNNVTITGNTISNQWNGIMLYNANSNLVGTAGTGNGNTISACASNGIYLGASNNNIILANSVSNVHSGNTGTPGACGWGIGLDYSYDGDWNPISPCSNNLIGDGTLANANDITNCDAGIIFYTNGTGNKANGNKIHGNVPHGLNNIGGAVVDATRNWWGNATGPTVAGNSCGTGDALTDEANVSYEPWKDGVPSWIDIYKLQASVTLQTDVSCFGGNDGSVTVVATSGTGISPYTYSIDLGQNYLTSGTFGSLTAGPYMVYVKDANDCIVYIPILIIEPTQLVAAIISQANVSCNGGNDGSVTVTATAGSGTAPYKYKLGTGGTYGSSGTFSSLIAGSYTVYVQDANLCEINVPVTITEPTQLAATITSQTNVSCNGENDGSVTVTASAGSGTAPYQYKLGTGGTYGSSGTFSSLFAGSYTVYVQDANLCEITIPVNITEPAVVDAPTAGNVTVYYDGLSHTGTATPPLGSTVVWYDAATGGNVTVAPSGINVGIYTAWAESVNSTTGCISATRTQVTVSINPAYELTLTVFLQGPYSAGQMSTALNSYLPEIQPFNDVPWSYLGEETLPDPLSEDAVDWVLVELRSDINNMVEQKAGLLYKDGTVSVSFTSSSPGGNYVVVWARNHMPVMSALKVNLPIEGAAYDLTSLANLYGHENAIPNVPAINLGGGIYGMIAGDVTKNGMLSYSGPGNDRGPIIARIVAENGGSGNINNDTDPGYWQEDATMNGIVLYMGGTVPEPNDRAIIYSNLYPILTGNYYLNYTYTSVVPGAYTGSKDGSNDGPVDIHFVETATDISIEVVTNELIESGMADNIQFTLAWKAGDTEVEQLLITFASDFDLMPQGDAVTVNGTKYLVYASVTPTILPDVWNTGEAVTVMTFEKEYGQLIADRLWIANNDITSNNNGEYYLSNWGSDVTGLIYTSTVGIETVEAGQMKLYPNPVNSNNLFVQMNTTGEEHLEIEIWDMTGNLFKKFEYQKDAGTATFTIDVSAFYSGVYFINVIGEKVRFTDRFIVK
jgi:parallel beta-helix repeat protein